MIKNFCKILSLILFAFAISILLSSCSAIDNKITSLNDELTKWEIDDENGSRIIYNNEFYQILDEEVEKDKVGKAIGRIGEIIILDENYKVIDKKVLNVSNIFDLGTDLDEDTIIVPFQNVYKTVEKDTKAVIVDINGKYYKATPVEKISENDVFIKFESIHVKLKKGFRLNEENYNQILSGDRIYSITDKIVDEKDLDILLDTINKTEVIDIKTGEKIDNDELNKVEIIPEEVSHKKRSLMKYGNVYSIKNMDMEKFVAIEINDEYRLAEVIN